MTQEQVDAIDGIVEEFLKFYALDNPPTPEELMSRHGRINSRIHSCGGCLDSWGVTWLFSKLEEKASGEIAKFVALAQTTDSGAMRKYGINEKLINNVIAVANEHRKNKAEDMAEKARDGKKDSVDRKNFITWAEQLPNDKRSPPQAEDIRGLPGFQVTWGCTDETLKKWWKRAFPGYQFRNGARKKSKNR